MQLHWTASKWKTWEMHDTEKMLENQGLLEQKGDRVNNGLQVLAECAAENRWDTQEQDKLMLLQERPEHRSHSSYGRQRDHCWMSRQMFSGSGSCSSSLLWMQSWSDTALSHSLVSHQDLQADETQKNSAQVLAALSSTCCFPLVTPVWKQALWQL